MDDVDFQRVVGSAIRRRREAAGVSQEALAGACGLHRTYVGSVERGERNVSIRNLARIAQALGCAVSDLVRDAETVGPAGDRRRIDVVDGPYELGSLEASEAILKELYIDLRSALRRWSGVTFQTPQARMGYVGQHLASVVTGYPGSRSGARGKDLILPEGKHAEIKTCYRVDQLGKCLDCEAVVASIEDECPSCGSDNIKRNDDSKWLIGVRNDDEMRQLFDPERYYLVLFDFADINVAAKVNARIYEVNPRERGFAYCMVDYHVNISPNSTAPFNLWPFQLKFETMKPRLIYHSVIDADDTITTRIFPGDRGEPIAVGPRPLTEYSRSQNLKAENIEVLAQELGAALPERGNKTVLLSAIEEYRQEAHIPNDAVADALAEALYRERIANARQWLPPSLR